MGPYGLEQIRSGEAEDFHTHRRAIENTISEGELRSYTEWANGEGQTVEAEGMFRIDARDADTAIECLLAEFPGAEASRVCGKPRVNFRIDLTEDNG